MPYVTRWEQRGRAEGLREGRQEGKCEGLRLAVYNNLDARFERVPEEVPARLELIDDLEVLNTLQRETIAAATIEAFLQTLARYSAA